MRVDYATRTGSGNGGRRDVCGAPSGVKYGKALAASVQKRHQLRVNYQFRRSIFQLSCPEDVPVFQAPLVEFAIGPFPRQNVEIS